MWKFLVKNQRIEAMEREVIASDQIAFVTLKFIFDGDWKIFHKVVQFTQCDETYNLVLGTDGTSCLLPAELHPGAVKMSVFGYDAENTDGLRATTVPVTLHIRPSGFVGDGTAPIPPTPDLYAQLLKKIEDATKGEDGKSAYELAVEEGFVGTLDEWLASLKGDEGLSAYEVAVKNGFVGTEEEWLDSLKYGGDLSEYAKKTDLYELILLVREAIAPLEQAEHIHTNKDILDRTTASYTAEEKEKLAGIDLTDYTTHTEFNDSILLIREALSALEYAEHTHTNKDVLDRITAENVANWNSITSLATQVTGLSNGLTTCSENIARNAVKIGSLESCNTTINETLESLQAQIDALSGDTSVTLFHHGSDTLTEYGEQIYTFYNDGYRSLAGFSESYPKFCCSDNDYALSYNLTDFGWGNSVYTMCISPTHITADKNLLISYQSGATDDGEFWIVPKSAETLSAAETARYIYEQISGGTATQIPFKWLYSETYVTVLNAFENVTVGDYYLAWKGVSDNSHPLIRMIKILEGT